MTWKNLEKPGMGPLWESGNPDMGVFTQFFKDYDFRSSGMAKTGCIKVFIYHIFFKEIWWHQKKPLMAWFLL